MSRHYRTASRHISLSRSNSCGITFRNPAVLASLWASKRSEVNHPHTSVRRAGQSPKLPDDPVRQLPGVSYRSVAGLNRPVFDCGPHRAVLTTTTCARMWRQAQSATRSEERHLACRACPIGAGHAGETSVFYSRLYGTMICPRCGKGTTRMIRDRVCVSCRNREYEWNRGFNAKGAPITEMRPLRPAELRYSIDGRPARFRTQLAVDTTEVVAHLLRTTRGKLSFGYQGTTRHLKQDRLL